jgi:hypothetical protein
MITVIRNADGTIKTFSENPENDFVFTNGETIEYIDTTFTAYAARFVLSCLGKSAETVRVRVGDPQPQVQISCPGQSNVAVDINGTTETLPLNLGKAQIMLSTALPGVFIIQPADRRAYPAGGQGLLIVEVLP